MKNIFKENKELKEENKELKEENNNLKRKSTYLTLKYETKIKREKELTKIIKNLEDRLNDKIKEKIADYDITSDVDAYLKLLNYKKGE